MPQLPEKLVKTVATHFSERIRHMLTKEQLAEAVRLNDLEPEGSGICHTHDFIDANEVMAETFASVYSADIVEEALLDSEHPANAMMVALWNTAWDRARIGKFQL